MRNILNASWRAAGLALATLFAGAALAADRQVRASELTMRRGETNRLTVSLEGAGDENRIAFTLCFDTNELAFVRAELGAAAVRMEPLPMLSLETANEAAGRVGVTLALDAPAAQAWPAGANQLLALFFYARGASAATATVSLCDAPVMRALAAADGSELEAEFFDAVVRIQDACHYVLATNQWVAAGNGGFGAVELMTEGDCGWEVVNTNGWIALTSPTNGVGSNTFSFIVAANPERTPRTGVIRIAGQEFTIAQDAACAYAVQPEHVLHGFDADTGTFTLATSGNCAWSVTTLEDWITITSATNGSGTAEVRYAVAANPGIAQRAGQVQVNGAVFHVLQAGVPCEFALAPESAVFDAAEATGAVQVTTPEGCVWSASTTNDWLTILSPAPTTNSGMVEFALASNVTRAERVGFIFIADATLVVTQRVAPCSFTLTATNAVHGNGAESGAVSVVTFDDCAWAVVNTNDWIRVPVANGQGSGAVAYELMANPLPTPRAGTLLVAGESFRVAQAAADCRFTLAATNAHHGAGATTSSVSVVTLDGCAWFVENTNDWIEVAPATGTNSGNVTLIVTANPSVLVRTGTLRIAGAEVTVSQAGVPCAFVLQPPAWVHRAVSETGMVGVAAQDGCAWSAVTTNEWIELTAAAGEGNGHAGYRLAPNTNAEPREGTIEIGGEAYAITQMGAACSYRLSPTNRIHGTGANANSFNVIASANCAWTVLNTNSWITLLTETNGSGNATVGYSIAQNRGPMRSGTINVAGEILSLTQWGVGCGFAVSPAGRAHGAGAESGTVTLSASSGTCAWEVVNTNAWIRITTAANGSGASTVGYSIEANASGTPRAGVFTVGNAVFGVQQAGAPCAFALAPDEATHSAEAGAGAVTVTTGEGCVWEVASSASWINLASATRHTNSGSVAYTLAANPSGLARTGAVSIAGQPFRIVQEGALCLAQLDATAASHSFYAATGAVTVTMPGGCEWVVANTNTWISFATLTGAGSATLDYFVVSNSAPVGLTGVVFIADQRFEIVQAGVPCVFLLSTSSATHGEGAATGSVNVSTDPLCHWEVVNTNAWITITSGNSGAGAGAVSYAVTANPQFAARSGFIQIGKEAFRVTQAAQSCRFTLLETSAAHDFGATTGAVSIATSNQCSWLVENTNDWITVVSGASGTGDGTVTYGLAENAGTWRGGIITIGGVPFAITQAGSQRVVRALDFAVARGATNRLRIVLEATGVENALAFSLCFDTNELSFVEAMPGAATGGPDATLTIDAEAASQGRVGVALGLDIGANATYRAGSNLVAEVMFRALEGIGFANTTVMLCDAPFVREVNDVDGAEIAAEYASATVHLLGTCSFALSGPGAVFSPSGGPGAVTVTANSFCAWTVANTNAWIGITSAPTNGNGRVEFAVAENFSGSARQGVIEVAGQSFTIDQDGLPCTFSLSANGATHGATTGTGTVHVSTIPGCTWSMVNTSTWIAATTTVSTGSGSVNYTFAANPSSAPRSAVLVIAGREFLVDQAGAPCEFVLSPAGRHHAYSGETGSVSVASPMGCLWVIESAPWWVRILSDTNGSGGASIDYAVAYNPDGQSRTGAVIIAGREFVVSQAGNPCPVTLAPATRSHGSDEETNSFTVSPGSGCAWQVVNTNDWVSILANSSGNGARLVTYAVAANPTTNARIAVLTVAGRAFTITQAGASCLFAITPAGRPHGPAAESGAFALETFRHCPWTVGNTSSWITITSGTDGTGSGVVNYDVAANPSSLSRTGVVRIARQSFTVVQAGAPCTFGFAPASRHHGAGAETNSVSVQTIAGCSWNVSTTNGWITFIGATNGTGSGSISYALTANPSSLARTGAVWLGTQRFTVSQAGAPCSFAVTPTNRTHVFTASTNTLSLATPLNCAWSIGNTNAWIVFPNGTNGSGPGALTYRLTPNPTAFARTGTVLVAGIPVTLSQAAAPCVYTLSATNVVRHWQEDLGSVDVLTLDGCPWMVSNSNTWIVEFSEVIGTGSATIWYLMEPNPTGLPRRGNLRIADRVFTVDQAAAPCGFLLSATNRAHGFGSATGTVQVTTLEGCAWTVVNPNSWISIANGSGVGSGSFTYAVSPNPLEQVRVGTISVGQQALTITQAALVCTYSINPSTATIASGNVTGLVSVAASSGCTWFVENTNEWINIKSGAVGTNNGLVRFTAASNPSPNPRVGHMTIAGRPYAVTQLGSPCSYTLSSTGRVHGSLLETAQVSVLTVNECSWSVENTNGWITILSLTNGTGNGLITYAVDANASALDRAGTFTVSGRRFTVTQLGAGCTYTFAEPGVLHGGLAETNSIDFFTPLNCAWTIAESNSWITLLSPASGTSSDTVRYTVSANVSGATRIGHIYVGGQAFTVMQEPVACAFEVEPTEQFHGFESETGYIVVLTSNVCPWNVTESVGWITVNSGNSYTGSAEVIYTVSANPSSVARTGTVYVAGQPITVRQAGLVCSYSLSAGSVAFGFNTATGQVAVTSPTLCSWPVQNTNSWITVLNGTNNAGPRTVNFSVAMNRSAAPRLGYLTVAGHTFGISQNGMPFLAPSNKTAQCGQPWSFDPPILASNCVIAGATVFVVSTTTNLGCGPTYTASRVWSAADACGSHVVLTQTVTVATPPPVMTCAPNKTVECGSGWSFDPPSAVEFCGGTNVSIRVFSTVTSTQGMCGASYKVTRTWEAFDSCGNRSTCSQTVTVVDTTPPVANCASEKTVECGSAWTFDPPTGTDLCGGTNVTIRVVSTLTNASACGFTARRTWEVIDGCGNRSTCSQTVIGVDSTGPALTCVPSKNVQCGTSWTFDAPAAFDQCSATNLTLTIVSTVTNSAGFCGNTFNATRTWQARDACGNVSVCSQTVRVIDTTPPVPSCAPNKTIEIGEHWEFDPPTGTDACGSVTIAVASTTTNTSGFCGNTYSATRTWTLTDSCSNQVTCAQTVTVRDTTAPDFLCAAAKVVNCRRPWSFDPPVAFDIGSGTNVTISIVSTVTNGTCGNNFTATRTWRARDLCGNSRTCSQTVTGRPIVFVSGQVYLPTNYPAQRTDRPVAGTTLWAPLGSNAVADAAGAYALAVDATNGAVMVTPTPPEFGGAADGVTTLDISLLRRHVLNSASLDSPYKLLAADVDGSGSVSTIDLSFIRRVVLGATNDFPAGIWRFVPANHLFANVLEPWNAPSHRTHASANADLTGQDFVGVKLGDVNGSWGTVSGASLAKGGRPTVGFHVGALTGAPGTTVVVHVRASGFRDVTSAQGTIEWDPSVVRYLGTGEYGLTGLGGGSFGAAQSASGRLSFSWDDPGANGVTVSDATVLFGVRFQIVGRDGSGCRVGLGDSVAVREASVNFAPATFDSRDGLVFVEEPGVTHLAAPALSNGQFQFRVRTVAGKTYTLESTDTLPAAQWTPLQTVSGDGTLKTFSHAAPLSQRQRFYRVRISEGLLHNYEHFP